MRCIPEKVFDLIAQLISKSNTQNVYVPFANGDEIEKLQELVETIDYYCDNDLNRAKISQKTGIKPIDDRSLINETYDFVFSDLPFGLVKSGSIQAKIVEKSVNNISKNGYAAFTFAENITLHKESIKWLEELQQKGLFMSAIIELEAGTYAPMTNVSSRVIIFTTQENDKVFLAKIKKPENISIIVDNYLSNNNSTTGDHLGRWFDRHEYRDYSHFETVRRADRIKLSLKKDFNGEMYSINDISVKVIPGKDSSVFEQHDNAVYIPKIGKTPVYTETESLQLKQQNYYQVLVDMEVIMPKYLAFVLNTDKGIELRESSMNGFIPKLNLDAVKRLEVPVTSIEIQESILALEDEIDSILNETERIKNQLHNKPVRFKNLRKDVKNINSRGDKFEQWIESLPYPVSTILRRYYTAENDQQRQEILFHFFEAYSIFETAILSGVYDRNVIGKISNVDSKHFEASTFGSWVTMDKQLSKAIREIIYPKKETEETKQRKQQLLDCFHTDDSLIIKTMCDKEIGNILTTVNGYRNGWKGHSGITSEHLYHDHVRELMKNLDKFRSRIGDLYEAIRLVRRTSIDMEDGQFINNVEILTGSNPIFKKDTIVGTTPLDKTKLYIQVIDSGETFELPPFFIFSNDPADVKNACYFYSKTEGDTTKYVSYHFENRPDSAEPGNKAYMAIRDMLGD